MRVKSLARSFVHAWRRFAWIIGGILFIIGLPGLFNDAALWWSWIGSGAALAPWLVAALGIALLALSAWHSVRGRRDALPAARPQARAEPKTPATNAPKSTREQEAEIMERLMIPITPPRSKAVGQDDAAAELQPQEHRGPSLHTSIGSLIVRGQELQDDLIERTRTQALVPVLGGPYARLGSRIEEWTREIDFLIARSGLPTRFRTSLRFRSRRALGLGVLGALAPVSSEELADQLDTNLRVLRTIAREAVDRSQMDTSNTAI